MRGPWSESVADHEAFARDGHGDALRRLLRRHGPLLLGLAATEAGARPEATLTRVVSGFVARRYRGAPEQWLPQFLRAVVSTNPADADTDADGRRALWLAGHAGLRELATASLGRLRERGLFNGAFLDALLDMQRDVHAAYYGELVWVLMVLELWLEAHAPATAG